MINSRKIEDLHPKVQPLAKQWKERCDKELGPGITVLITSTYRDNASQDALYAIGRTVTGKKVTNAKAGQSFHNYRVALDFVPCIHGKPLWNRLDLFEKAGVIAESLGFTWAGRWKGKFRESAHIQYTNGKTLKDFQNGYKL